MKAVQRAEGSRQAAACRQAGRQWQWCPRQAGGGRQQKVKAEAGSEAVGARSSSMVVSQQARAGRQPVCAGGRAVLRARACRQAARAVQCVCGVVCVVRGVQAGRRAVRRRRTHGVVLVRACRAVVCGAGRRYARSAAGAV